MLHHRSLTAFTCNDVSLFKLLVIVLLASVTNTALADTIVLDDFSQIISPDSGVVTFSGSGAGSSTFDALTGEISLAPNTTASWTETLTGPARLWNKRSGDLAASGGTSNATLYVDNGFLAAALPNDLSQSLTFSYYDSPDVEKNLTAAGDVFYLKVLTSDNNVAGSIKLYDANGQTGTAGFVIGGTGVPSTVSVSLASIYQTVNRSRITRADVSLVMPNATDLQLDSMYFAPVPEPSSVIIGLMAAVFTGITVARKRRASRTAS